MGQGLAKDYEMMDQTGSGGPRNLWKIYDAVNRKNGSTVSVFVFDKQAHTEQTSKRETATVCEVLKRGLGELQLVRHPRILHPIEVLPENRAHLAFTTEPVFCSLANLLKNCNNLPSVPREISSWSFEHLEIQSGSAQLVEGLAFLHSKAKLIHGNVCPENVFVMRADMSWKLGGFDFVTHEGYKLELSVPKLFGAPLTPNLDFAAPELVSAAHLHPGVDVFALGALLFETYTLTRLVPTLGSVATFEHHVETAGRNVMGPVSLMDDGALAESLLPAVLRPVLNGLLLVDPDQRSSLTLFARSAFFSGVAIRSLRYLDKLVSVSQRDKVNFLKGLGAAMDQFPRRVREQRLLPPLLLELRDPHLAPFVVPPVMSISGGMTKRDFVADVLPGLLPAITAQDPPQVPLLFLDHLTTLFNMCPADVIASHLVPTLLACYDAPDIDIQTSVVGAVQEHAGLVEYAVLKKELLPRLAQLCLHSPSPAVRASGTRAFARLAPLLDKWVVEEMLLPMLRQIAANDASPNALMALLDAYTTVAAGVAYPIIASSILPVLIPMSLSPGLTTEQHAAFADTLHTLLQRVSSDHAAMLNSGNAIGAPAMAASAPAASGTGIAAIADAFAPADTIDNANPFDPVVSSNPFGSPDAPPPAKITKTRSNTNPFASETDVDPFSSLTTSTATPTPAPPPAATPLAPEPQFRVPLQPASAAPPNPFAPTTTIAPAALQQHDSLI